MISPEIRALFHGMFGEIIPLTDEEQEAWFRILHQPQHPFPMPVLPQISDQVPIPTIEIPRSAFVFFRSECAKRKPLVSIKIVGQRKEDPHSTNWKSLSEEQRTNWTNLFMLKRDIAEMLVLAGVFQKAPSENERKREQRRKSS